MTRFLVAAMMTCLTALGAQADSEERAELKAFASARLIDAILLYDQHFRVPETGQYLDALRLGGAAPEPLSSTAATGMGLISLALGDQLGLIPDASAKAEVTLRHLLGEVEGSPFTTERSKSGWYRHWFDARTGAVPDWNPDKFSTIDTAILAAGAAILSNHLRRQAETQGTPVPEAADLAARLVSSVDWRTAVRNPKRGSIHLIFYGVDEVPTETVATIPFDEYALLPCMAARYEDEIDQPGDATAAWETRFDMTEELPMADRGGLTLLSKPSGSVPSHFTHQFAFHLCGTYARDPEFLAEMGELMQADRAWFEAAGAPPDLWGLGAGSELVLEPAETEAAQTYGVARLDSNPNATASPAVMAGFLAVDEVMGQYNILRDLKALWDRDACRYSHEDLGFLWRCAIRDTSLAVNRVEAIDFSTWMLGLATAHPDIGLVFFQRNTY